MNAAVTKKTKAPTRFIAATWADDRVELPVRIESEANLRGNWRWGYGRGLRQRKAVKIGLTVVNQHKPSTPCVVTLTRIASRALDDDNLKRSLKAPRDEVAAWLGIDDRDPGVFWAYAEERGAARVYGLRIAWRASTTEEIEQLRRAARGELPREASVL